MKITHRIIIAIIVFIVSLEKETVQIWIGILVFNIVAFLIMLIFYKFAGW